jgi:hypothetical protein
MDVHCVKFIKKAKRRLFNAKIDIDIKINIKAVMPELL